MSGQEQLARDSEGVGGGRGLPLTLPLPLPAPLLQDPIPPGLLLSMASGLTDRPATGYPASATTIMSKS